MDAKAASLDAALTPTNEIAVWIAQLRFNDGAVIDLDQNDCVLIVGPNNAGKSATLAEIRQKADQQAAVGRILTAVTLQKKGSIEAVQGWFAHETIGAGAPQITIRGTSYDAASLKIWWLRPDLPNISHLFIKLCDAQERLSAAQSAPSIRFGSDSKTLPVHYVYDNDEIEKRLSAAVKEAFGQELVVDRAGGASIALYFGPAPNIHLGEDRVSHGYLQRLRALPMLASQGDGVKSFVGMLLHATVMEHFVVLADEPEAFLHPPQARLLGRMLVKQKPVGRQLFFSTHSSDFVKGVLDANTSNVRILRIRRESDLNPVAQLDAGTVRKIWSDPILRSSNVIDGLFHELVVLCESDGDCRFYSAVMDAIYDARPATRRPDVLFTHCNGKHKMPAVVDALRALSVPIRVVSDIDVLREETPLRQVIEGLGGSWGLVVSQFKAFGQMIANLRPQLGTADAKKQISELFEAIETPVLPDDALKKLRTITKQSSAWGQLKRAGKAVIPSGAAQSAFEHIQQYAEGVGLFVVPIGELESFDRSIAEHGPEWVNAALQQDLLRSPNLADAREFVMKVLEISP
jgi:hypothetical protein